MGSGKEIKNYLPPAAGNYIMDMSIRSDGTELSKTGNSDGPAPARGIQLIPENTVNPGGYNVSSNYGGGRIRLEVPPTSLLGEGQSTIDRSLHLHGKGQLLNRRTHGCVCDKDETVFNYFWNGDGKSVKLKVPFFVSYKNYQPNNSTPTWIQDIKKKFF